MILSLHKLGNEIKLTEALKFSYLCTSIVFLLLIFLYLGHSLKFNFGYSINLPFFNGKSYPLPPNYLINYEYWNWIEALRPIIISICITLILFLTMKSFFFHKTMLILVALVAIFDISSWVSNKTFEKSGQYSQLETRYRNNMVNLESLNGFQPPTLGLGRAMFFGLPENLKSIVS